MVNKKDARKNGVKIIESGGALAENNNALLEKLKELLPGVVKDGQLDARALRAALDIADSTENNQGYELTFAGKGIARAKADSPTMLELKPEPAQSKNFGETGNMVIRGDNIDALKILYQNYYGKIKMIYIDPPYNTQTENFIYNDNFKKSEAELIEHFGLGEDTADFLHNVYGTRSHSGWLSFMYPRLKLARELLREDGLIFMSIDENEQANLKIICDEIFGESNCLAGLIHQKKSGGGQAGIYYKGHDYIFAYAKNAAEINGIFKRDAKKLKTVEIDGNVYWYDTDVVRRVHGKYDSKDGPRNLFYEDMLEDRKRRYEEDIKNKKYILIQDAKTKKHYVSKYGLVGEKMKLLYSILSADDIYDLWNSSGSDALANLSMSELFENPKPVDLVKLFLSNTRKGDIILDFFAGSGTTGEAAMQFGAENGGNRKFILVQWDEEIDKNTNSAAHKFCTENNLPPVISSICIERLNRAGEKIKEEQNGNGAPPDTGYKVFSVKPKPQTIQDENGLFAVENGRANAMETLYNMLAATCKPLDTPVECLLENTLYKADGELYLLANTNREELEKYPDTKINLDGWADISLEQYLNLDVINNENIAVIY